MKNEVTVLRPNDLDTLDRVLLQNTATWTFVAGGTDLLVQKEKWQRATHIVDLTALPSLHKTIESDTKAIRIGAAVPYGTIIRDPLLNRHFPILVQACRLIGAAQIQNRGTIGGNIANASPAGDTLPVLAVLNAQLLIGPRREERFKRIPVEETMSGPGKIVLKKNEYIAFIELPLLPLEGLLWDFRKIGQRGALAISKLSLAVILWKERGKIAEARIASGSVAPVIKRHRKTEQVLSHRILNEEAIEKAAQVLKTEITPIDDIRSTREYRLETTANVLKDILFQWL